MKRFVPIAALLLSAGVAQASDWVGTYGLISKVVFEPNAERPQRMQIFGVFAMAAPADRTAYLAPERGFIYVQLPADNQEQALKEWADLKEVAGRGTVIGFGSRVYGPSKWRIRKEGEKLSSPDVYHTGIGLQRLRGVTDYAPVKALLEFK